MARVIEGGREYESTEGSREASTTDVAVPTEAPFDASVQTEDPTDSIVLPTEFEPTDSAVVPTEFEPTGAAVIVPRVDASVLELSDREGKDSVRESNEEVRESDKEVSESEEKEEEVRELSIDGQGCDNEEEERVGDAEGRERSGDNEEEDVAGVVKNIVDDIAAEEEDRVNDVAADTDEDDDDEESQPLPPESMYFGPTEYNKVCKVGSRCRVGQTVAMIEAFDEEVSWFRNHAQFKHIFHMPKEPNHMIQDKGSLPGLRLKSLQQRERGRGRKGTRNR